MRSVLDSFFSYLWRDFVTQEDWRYWVILSIVVGMLILAYRRRQPIENRKLSLLALLPSMWIFMGLWAGYLDTYHKGDVDYDPVLHYPDHYGLFLYLVCAIGLIAYLRGARLFASLFAILNLLFMLAMSIEANEAVRI